VRNLADTVQAAAGDYSQVLLILLLIVGMYFVMIRPQQKRRREVAEMQSSIGVGDEILTIGGLYGTVTEIEDEYVTLEVAPGVTNRYIRAAVSKMVNSAAKDESN